MCIYTPQCFWSVALAQRVLYLYAKEERMKHAYWRV